MALVPRTEKTSTWSWSFWIWYVEGPYVTPYSSSRSKSETLKLRTTEVHVAQTRKASQSG